MIDDLKDNLEKARVMIEITTIANSIIELYHHGGCTRAIDYLQRKLTTLTLTREQNETR